MASKKEYSITDWKKLWQLVSGIHYETPNETVKQKLFDVSKDLQDGILQFKKCSSTSGELEKFLKDKKQDKLFLFTNKLQYLLDLETEQCWDILCYYLVNEYRGSATTLSNFIATEANMTKLLDDIWGYYSLERIIVLKIVKNMLEFYQCAGHPYQMEYKFVLDKISLEKFRQSYLNQLDYLVKESPPSKLANGEFFNYNAKLVAWSERNSREINEILHILILIIQYDDIKPSEVKKLLDCFKLHAFGRQQRYLDYSNDYHNDLMMKIAYSEVAIFLLCVDLSERQRETSWTSDVLSLLDKDVILLHHNPEHGPLLLSWMLINFRTINIFEDEDSVRRYRQFGVKSMQLKVFKYLKDLISHRMFNDESLVSKIIRRCIYNHLSHLCDLFDGDGSVTQHPHVYELLCELLSSPSIAMLFCDNEESGARSLYNTALENFPIDFIHLSMIAYGLSIAGQTKYVKQQLENLPIYAEIYDEFKFILKPSMETEDGFVLHQDYIPFSNIDYKIPAETTAVVVNKQQQTFVHFRTELNYFNVLHNEINLLISEAIQYSGLNLDRLKRVNAGIKYLSVAIARIKSPSEISQEMVHPTEMCIDVLNKLKSLPNPPIDLLANCLNVCGALLPSFETEIFPRIINLNILPFLTNETLDFKKYAHGVCFDSSLVGFYLVNIEKKMEKYDFLLAYLNFLRNYSKLGKNKLYAMEIPGLIFLLREVFPHIHSWRFQSLEQRNKIYMQILRYICDILDIVTTDRNKESGSRTILRDICVYSLLNLDNGIVLLKFVAIGNPFLQASMEHESNWITSSSTSILLLVRLSMKILMQLLRLKTTILESTDLSPLETLIYTQPKQRDTLRIIPVVTSYMSNIFDRWLPILSCRLLRRIALEFKMSLLACLDMEPDQIRLTFLQRLPDDLESDDLKIAILEFIEACIEKQPGLTEAFFKMNFERERKLFVKDKSSNIGDSILPFMQDYLEAVEKEPCTAEAQLPSRIMSLFHSLWKNNMQSLVQELMNKSTFWTSLCKPLFGTLKKHVRVYGQLLNILGIELFCSDSNIPINSDLKTILNQFFEEETFDKWIEQVFDLPYSTIEDHVDEETPEWLSRLQSFKDFIIIFLKKNVKGVEIPSPKMKIFATKCLEVLVTRGEYTDDLRPFIILSELYFMVLLSFKHSYTETEAEDKEMLSQIIKLFNNVAICYEDLHVRAKESCLSAAIKSANLLSTEIMKNPITAFQLLNPIIDIICFELNNLEITVKTEIRENKSEVKTQSKSLVLSLNLLKTVAAILHTEGPTNWDQSFTSSRIFNRLLDCISWILPMSSKHMLSNELLDVLIVFAKGNCSYEFLHCDVGSFLWLKLLPPKELLQSPYILQQPKDNSWIMQNWWPIYSRGIELVTILLQKHDQHFLKDALTFVGIHEEYLMDSLLLAKQSLEPNAMILIKVTVDFISELIANEKEWRMEHSQSLYNLIRCTQILMDHVISLLYRPKILKRLSEGLCSQPETILEIAAPFFAEDILSSMNDLTEIISLCVKCFLRFSPNLLDLICEPEFLVSRWEPLIEIQFGAPKLNAGSYPQLTFGAVLSAVAILTKALNLQNYGFQEIPLNILPLLNKDNTKDTLPSSSKEASAGLNRGTPARGCTPSNSLKPFLKSMSVTSVTSISSTAAPSNELLSNMDGELCLSCLELILTLLASQSLLALKNINLSNREKQLIRREISTELIGYHEFVRKKVLVDVNYHKSIWYRKKHGIVMMMDCYDSAQHSKDQSIEIRRSADHKNSMRVNVVRRLHLQQQQEQKKKSSFEMSQIISPIASSSHKKSVLNLPAISSTPNLGQQNPRKSLENVDNIRTINEEGEEEEEDLLPSEEPKYSPLSYVQLVEEDYLHFLSNLFTVICQSD